jgi:hypothetical protein
MGFCCRSMNLSYDRINRFWTYIELIENNKEE